MKHKLIAAAAAALAFSSLPVMAGVANASAAPSPTISSVTFTNVGTYPNSWGESGSYSAQPNTSLSPYEKATMTITGTNLGSSTAPAQVAFAVKMKGQLGLTSSLTAKSCPTDATFNGGTGNGGNAGFVASGGICVSKGSVNSNNGTTFTATVLGPQGNNFFMLQKKGVATYNQAALEIDFTPTGTTKAAKYKGTDTIDSNCGVNLQTSATPGKSYGLDANGEPLTSGTATNAPQTTYSDVSLNVLGVIVSNLCTPDIGIAAAGPTAPNTLDYPAWASNYPVRWTTSASNGSGDGVGSTHSFTGVSFGFPYTSAQVLKIYGVTQTYTLSNYDKTGASNPYGCSAGGQSKQPTGLIKANINCSISTKGVVTISDNVDVTNYTAGDTISGPVVDIVAKGKAAGAMNLIPGNDTSEIGLSDGTGTPAGCTFNGTTWDSGAHTLCVAVVFGPRAQTANASYAALSN